MNTKAEISYFSQKQSPFTKQQIKHGLEWISGKVRITVEYHWDNIDVVLYPNYPMDDHISLFLNVGFNNRVRVTDLVGNGDGTRYQHSGYGTLIFNIGIQAISAYYGIALTDIAANTIVVSGEVSSVGDPKDEPGRSQCGKWRNVFWSSFGFRLKNEEAFNTSMKAKLADLRIKMGGLTASGVPRYIRLEDFWLQGEAPLLFRSDLSALMATNLDAYKLGEMGGVNNFV